MRVLYPHNICMLPCRVLGTVPGPLDLYKLYGSISELLVFPVQYVHRMHLQDTFWFHLNHIPIDYMISIRYIYFLSNEIWDTLGTVTDEIMQPYMQCICMYIQTNSITLKLYTIYTSYNKIENCTYLLSENTSHLGAKLWLHRAMASQDIHGP